MFRVVVVKGLGLAGRVGFPFEGWGWEGGGAVVGGYQMVGRAMGGGGRSGLGKQNPDHAVWIMRVEAACLGFGELESRNTQIMPCAPPLLAARSSGSWIFREQDNSVVPTTG